MTKDFINSPIHQPHFRAGQGLSRRRNFLSCIAAAVGLLAGCGTPPQSSAAIKSPPPEAPAPAAPVQPPSDNPGEQPEAVTIHEGDVLKIAFPGAPKLDTTQQVRADGMITLDVVGEVRVTGQSPLELQKRLAQMFASQLVSNEVVVTLVSSSFDVFVTGAVLKPGKITSNKPITAFQAVMEAGYDPVNSNLEKVVVIREENHSKYTYIPLNLQLVLDGKDTQPFYLNPSDTLAVPKKVNIF